MTSNSYPYERPDIAPVRLISLSLLAIFFFVVSIISLLPSTSPPAVQLADKITHAGAHAVLAGLVMIAFPRWPLKNVFLLSFVYGAAIEIVQWLMHMGRTASVFDQIANIVGASAAIGIWMIGAVIIKRFSPH